MFVQNTSVTELDEQEAVVGEGKKGSIPFTCIVHVDSDKKMIDKLYIFHVCAELI
jgi:hypothetical protein